MKRILMLAAAGAFFFGAQNLSAQCTGHEHKTASHESHQCNGKGACCAQKKEQGATIGKLQTITRDQLVTMIKANEVTVIDARDNKSFEAGHIDGAQHVDAGTLPADKNARLVFYCGGLKCPAASKAAKKAIESGYKNVMVFSGGWAEWSKNS